MSLKGGMLCFNGKRVVKREKLHDIVKRMYKSSKGSGVRKIYHKLKNSYSGVAERDVHEVLAKSTVHQRLNVRFENKARLRPRTSRRRLREDAPTAWWHVEKETILRRFTKLERPF